MQDSDGYQEPSESEFSIEVKERPENDEIESLIQMLEKVNTFALTAKMCRDKSKDDVTRMKQEINDLMEENNYWREMWNSEQRKRESLEKKLSNLENNYLILQNENKYQTLRKRKSIRKVEEAMEQQSGSAPSRTTASSGGILVFNLSPRVTHEDLSGMFGHIGQLKRIILIQDYADPDPGYAEIIFCSKDDAKRAIEVYQDVYFDGMRMKCLLEH